MLKKLPKEDFKIWRRYGDITRKEKIENYMIKTEYWKNREQDILVGSGSPRSYENKRSVIKKMTSPIAQKFFQEHEDTYFPDISKMTPLEKIENVLYQVYIIPDKTKRCIDIDEYTALLDTMGWEIYSLINQTATIIGKEELEQTIRNMRLSEVNEMVKQTNTLARQAPLHNLESNKHRTGR